MIMQKSLAHARSPILETAGGVISSRPPSTVNHRPEDADSWRILMVDLAHLLSSCFLDIRLLAGIHNRDTMFSNLTCNYERLSRMPQHNHSFITRFRGFSRRDKNAAGDYSLQLGDVSVDNHIINQMHLRGGVHTAHLPGRLEKTFTTFADLGINTLRVFIPPAGESSPPLMEMIQDCLQIICRFPEAVRLQSPIVFEKGGHKQMIPLTVDENGYPDLNLTLLSGVNGLQPRYMQQLVRKVNAWMNRQTESGGNHSFVSVYEAILGEKNLRKKLVRPPIEVNNIKWLGITDNNMVLSRKQVQIFKLASELFRSDPQQAAVAIQTVYGRDYPHLTADHLTERMETIDNMLRHSAETSASREISGEIVHNMRKRLEQVPGDVFRNMRLTGNRIQALSGPPGKEAPSGPAVTIHQMLRRVFLALKTKADAAGPDLEMADAASDVRNYETLSRMIKGTPEEAREISELLDCALPDGQFNRKRFDAMAPQFSRLGARVLPLLWEREKELPDRRSRVAFLMTMQKWIVDSGIQSDAVKILLDKVLTNPQEIRFSDRNALMLTANLIPRQNIAGDMDVEMTAEAILMVCDEVDISSGKQARQLIEERRDDLQAKLNALVREIISALEGESLFTVRFLTFQVRELYLLLGIIGGGPARAVLRHAIRLYGNPDSPVYRSHNAPEYHAVYLQLLTIAVRALTRSVTKDDLPLFSQIKSAKGRLLSLSSDPRLPSKVERLMRFTDRAREEVRRKSRPNAIGALAFSPAG